MSKKFPHEQSHQVTFWDRPLSFWIVITPLAVIVVVLSWLAFRRDQETPAQQAEAAAYTRSELQAEQAAKEARQARRHTSQAVSATAP